MKKYQHPFEPGLYYHVYNHANGSENVFREKDNYRFFMGRYDKYLSPLVETYAYCLMKNHFHLLIKVKDQTSIVSNSTKKTMDVLDVSKRVSKAFGNLFNSYTKAYNKRYQRMGSLFIPNVRRKCISDDTYLKQCIVYIHNNPIHHKFVKSLDDWEYSSYQLVLNNTNSFIASEKVLALFADRTEYLNFHKENIDLKSSFN